jgi:hypothetical protein
VFRGTAAIFAALGAYYNRIGLLTLVNVITLLYSVPLLAVALITGVLLRQLALTPLALALLLGILPNPLAAGLQHCARLAVRDEPFVLSDLQRGLQEYWRPALLLFVIGLVALLVILLNLSFYARVGGALSTVLALIWLYLLILWLAVHLYAYPLLFTVERPTWRKAVLLVYRNALVLAVTRPVSTILVGAVWLFWLLLTSATGLMLLVGLVVAALIQQALLLRLLPTYGIEP